MSIKCSSKSAVRNLVSACYCFCRETSLEWCSEFLSPSTILSFVFFFFKKRTDSVRLSLGINLITYYAAQIYEQYIGLDGFTSRILAAANGTEYFLASWIAVFTIERFGRRSLMLFGAAGMAASMAVLAGSTSVQGSGVGIVAAAFLFIFNTFFAIGWLGMTWLYPAEIVPLRIRAPANALSTSANWAFNVSSSFEIIQWAKTDQYSSWLLWSHLWLSKALDTRRTSFSPSSMPSSSRWYISSTQKPPTEGTL